MELVIDGVGKKFGEKEVLKGASFRFEKGKIYGLLGRNGAGKTTLFNCISGELEWEEGKIELIGGREDLAREEQVGYVYTEPLLPEFLTGHEFLRFFLSANEKRISAIPSIEECLRLVKIDEDDWHRLIKGYSHGMKNKLHLLTVLITKPPVILLDEPLTSFDVIVALEIKKILKDLRHEHVVIFSTHVLQLATDICDEIVLLHNGKLQVLAADLLGKPEFEENIREMLSVAEND